MDETIEIYWTSIGQKIEITVTHWQETTPQGPRYKKTFSVFPPLSDGITPSSVSEIRECKWCCGVFHFQSTKRCRKCNGIGCGDCIDETGYCKKCLDENHNLFD